LLAHDYATPTGGAEILTRALRDGLRDRGHDARWFASSARPAGGNGGLADYECYGAITAPGSAVQAVNVHAYWRLRRALASFRPDVVHVGIFLTQLSPLILPLVRDFPSVHEVHWARAVCPIGTKTLPDGSACEVPAGVVCCRNGCLSLPRWGIRMLPMSLWRRWRSAFDVIAVNSEAMRRLMVAEGFGPLEVVPPGVPDRGPRPPLIFPPTVAFAGRLIHSKGVDVLVRAFARVVERVPDARLLIIGSGEESRSLEGLAAALGVASRITQVGWQARPDMEKRLASAWVQVVPSRSFEAFGMVAAEAMMRGTAVVVSAVGGLPEIVDDGRTGRVVPPNNHEALADVLAGILEDRAIAERMGTAAREVARRRFLEAAYVDRFVAIYRGLCQ